VDHYGIKDVAMKVVGVGSVGTYCAILLMMTSDNDSLFLQVKEARTSVLEPHAGKVFIGITVRGWSQGKS
jgi:hypothetical protein